VTAFDTLFWLLIVMLAVVAYAIEAGIAVRHRTAVLSTLFSVIGAILYIMVIGDEHSLGRAWSTPGVNVAMPGLPKIELKDGIDKAVDIGGMDIFKSGKASPKVERQVPKTPFTDCDNCPSMIGVVPGRFTMGSPETQVGRRETEGPAQISIDYPFTVGRFEVTRDQYAMFVDETKHQAGYGCLVNGRQSSGASWHNPGFEQAGNHPVVCVGWRDAKAYVGWLSRKSGKPYRLLSEAEWEYMARAGARSAFTLGDNLSAAHANFNRNRDGTIPIGFTTANLFSVHDVLGNVWEMVEDCWNPDLAFNNADGRATILRGDCSLRVIKGGAWDSSALQARLGARATIETSAAANTVGFRVARSLD
jgi:formylglycine-generating enzyme required for sulfatase activity